MRKPAILLILLLTACSAGPLLPSTGHAGGSQPISICTVVDNGTEYDGKDVLLRASYQWQPHGGILFGQSCLDHFVALTLLDDYRENPRAASVLSRLRKEDASQEIGVVFRGIFHVAKGLGTHWGPSLEPGAKFPRIECLNVSCAQYKLEAEELVEAYPVAQ